MPQQWLATLKPKLHLWLVHFDPSSWKKLITKNRSRVSVRWDPRVGGQRCSWQQEDQDHPSSPSAGRAKRRRAEQTVRWSDAIAQGGVLPNIQAVLLPKKTEKKSKA